MLGMYGNTVQKICTDWAMKEFNTADEEDRSGLADQGTARAFYAGEHISAFGGRVSTVVARSFPRMVVK